MHIKEVKDNNKNKKDTHGPPATTPGDPKGTYKNGMLALFSTLHLKGKKKKKIVLLCLFFFYSGKYSQCLVKIVHLWQVSNLWLTHIFFPPVLCWESCHPVTDLSKIWPWLSDDFDVFVTHNARITKFPEAWNPSRVDCISWCNLPQVHKAPSQSWSIQFLWELQCTWTCLNPGPWRSVNYCQQQHAHTHTHNAKSISLSHRSRIKLPGRQTSMIKSIFRTNSPPSFHPGCITWDNWSMLCRSQVWVDVAGECACTLDWLDLLSWSGSHGYWRISLPRWWSLFVIPTAFSIDWDCKDRDA